VGKSNLAQTFAFVRCTQCRHLKLGPCNLAQIRSSQQCSAKLGICRPSDQFRSRFSLKAALMVMLAESFYVLIQSSVRKAATGYGSRKLRVSSTNESRSSQEMYRPLRSYLPYILIVSRIEVSARTSIASP
jgi:hypothetical protein